jgi:hypothetical protein
MSQTLREQKKRKRKVPVRMSVVLELKAIIDRCKALTKNRIKKTIFMVFNERTTVELGVTLRELATAFEGNDSTDAILKMHKRLQEYRKQKDNKTIVPYPVKTREGIHYHFNHQTKQEYKKIQKMRSDVKEGNDAIEKTMTDILNTPKIRREQSARAEEAEVEYQISNNKKKRKKGTS